MTSRRNSPPNAPGGPAGLRARERLPHATGTDLICRGLVVRALRRAGLQIMLKGGAGVATISVDDPRVADVVARASCDLLQATMCRRRTDWRVVDLVSRRPAKSSVMDFELFQEDGDREVRVVFIIDEGTRLSGSSVGLIDGHARLGEPDWGMVRSAFSNLMRKIPAKSLPPEMLAVIPLAAYGSAIRTGAGCNRALARLRRFAELRLAKLAEATECSVDGPRLEELHGLGGAGRWGLDLARDLQEFRAGRLRWRDVDRGVLLSGPIGSGKTTFAQALGRTCNVSVHVHSLATWQAKGYLNDVLKAMHGAFASAKAAAPSILFIDEIDSFGEREQLKGHNATYSREVVNALLECLDGATDREGVIVVGATNHPDVVDAALKRPGRLDRHIAIPLPDLAARIGILRFHLVGDLVNEDLTSIADRLEGASGAVLEQIVRDGRRSARVAGRPLTVADLEAGLRSLICLSDAAFRRVCVHEAGHLVTGVLLESETGSKALDAVVTRTPAGPEAGRTHFALDAGFDRTRGSVLAEAIVLLAGIAGERIVLGSSGFGSGGARDSDLAVATRLLAEAELCHGLGDRLAYVGPLDDVILSSWLQRDAGLREVLDQELKTCLKRAVALLTAERDALEMTATRLCDQGRALASEVREKLGEKIP